MRGLVQAASTRRVTALPPYPAAVRPEHAAQNSVLVPAARSARKKITQRRDGHDPHLPAHDRERDRALALARQRLEVEVPELALGGAGARALGEKETSERRDPVDVVQPVGGLAAEQRAGSRRAEPGRRPRPGRRAARTRSRPRAGAATTCSAPRRGGEVERPGRRCRRRGGPCHHPGLEDVRAAGTGLLMRKSLCNNLSQRLVYNRRRAALNAHRLCSRATSP